MLPRHRGGGQDLSQRTARSPIRARHRRVDSGSREEPHVFCDSWDGEPGKIGTTRGGQENQRAAQTAAGVPRRFIFGGQKNEMTERSGKARAIFLSLPIPNPECWLSRPPVEVRPKR